MNININLNKVIMISILSDHGKYLNGYKHSEDWSKELEYANKQQYDFYWFENQYGSF